MHCLFRAWHKSIRLGYVHAARPDPSEELGQPIAQRLVYRQPGPNQKLLLCSSAVQPAVVWLLDDPQLAIH